MSNLGDFYKAKELKPGVPKKGWFIIRLDGKAFHTFTNQSEKPFDVSLSNAMQFVTKQLCSEIQNTKMAYTQSDEISIVMSDLDSDQTSLWYDGDIQKICSVAASIATAHFNNVFKHQKGKLAYFDARVFRLESEEEVQGYLVWRQRDSIKNAITLISLKHYSHKEIHAKHSGDKKEMIIQKGDSLCNYQEGLVNGFMAIKSYKQVPFEKPKNKTIGLVNRSFWKELPSVNFSEQKFLDVINKNLTQYTGE